MQHLSKSTAIILLVATCAWATEPWRDKPYQKWDEKEVKKILHDSPWAKPITAPALWTRIGGEKFETAPALTIGRVPNDPAHTDLDPNPVVKQTFNPDARLTLRWASSRTMRSAKLRDAQIKSQPIDKNADYFLDRDTEEYELVLVWDPMILFPQANEFEVAGNTVLKAKSTGLELHPNRVRFSGPSGQKPHEIVFTFPKKLKNGEAFIEPSEMSIEFYWRIGAGTVKSGFDPRKMLGPHGRDL
ncbi:MAG: hypothetical protein HY046_11435 [Acidobacteria bacterium]|nr:hypothetical protein [Acidobacteriota bacterium]